MRRLPQALLAVTALAFAVLEPVAAQSGQEQRGQAFVARLSTVPIIADEQVTVSGRGTATAVLEGRTLTVTGTFEGLRTPATVARLHLAPRAARGPAFADLKASSGTSGTIAGTVELTPQQLQALERRSLYIQLHSQKAPDGNLWGWLLPQEIKK